MKITCTVHEFAAMVRACHDASTQWNCKYCVLYELCSENSFQIENYVSAADIVAEKEADRATD